MRCGKCGGFDFEVHVRPETVSKLIVDPQTTARVAELICLGCMKVRVVDDKGVIQAPGRVEPTKSLDPDYVAPDPTDIRAKQVREGNE
jgi:hypothetical protein